MVKNGSTDRVTTEVTVAWRTLFQIMAGCLLAYLAVRLWRFEQLLLLALLIAVAFRPVLQWTAKHAWPRWTAIAAAALILFGGTALVFGILIPTVSHQGIALIEKLPELKEDVLRRVARSGAIKRLLEPLLSAPPFSNPQPLLKDLLTWSTLALERVGEYLIVLVLALYLVADGGRVYRWLAAFWQRDQRWKLVAAADEITSVVSHYVVGNLITSLLAAIYAFGVLHFLHVPNAALLAILAGVLDLLPIIGFFLFIIPAVLLALTVSPSAAIWVAVLYGAYHLLENYFIVPKVYGNRLRLSTLTVLVSCLAAGWIAGVIGVLIILPLVACYPVIERLWLGQYLDQNTLTEHATIDARPGG
ncbi:MAG: AI-2E family transporter [Verrucomicrobiota bacterium]